MLLLPQIQQVSPPPLNTFWSSVVTADAVFRSGTLRTMLLTRGNEEEREILSSGPSVGAGFGYVALS